MRRIEIELPDFVSVDENDVTMLIASRLYEQGKLSLGQAAQVSGLSKRSFMEILGKYDVSITNYDDDEIEMDFLNA